VDGAHYKRAIEQPGDTESSIDNKKDTSNQQSEGQEQKIQQQQQKQYLDTDSKTHHTFFSSFLPSYHHQSYYELHILLSNSKPSINLTSLLEQKRQTNTHERAPTSRTKLDDVTQAAIAVYQLFSYSSSKYPP